MINIEILNVYFDSLYIYPIHNWILKHKLIPIIIQVCVIQDMIETDK